MFATGVNHNTELKIAEKMITQNAGIIDSLSTEQFASPDGSYSSDSVFALVMEEVNELHKGKLAEKAAQAQERKKSVQSKSDAKVHVPAMTNDISTSIGFGTTGNTLSVTKIYKQGRKYIGFDVTDNMTHEVRTRVAAKVVIDAVMAEQGTRNKRFVNMRVQVYKGKIIPRPQGEIEVVQWGTVYNGDFKK